MHLCVWVTEDKGTGVCLELFKRSNKDTNPVPSVYRVYVSCLVEKNEMEGLEADFRELFPLSYQYGCVEASAVHIDSISI